MSDDKLQRSLLTYSTLLQVYENHKAELAKSLSPEATPEEEERYELVMAGIELQIEKLQEAIFFVGEQLSSNLK